MRLIIEGTMAEISNVLSALREKELLPSETGIEKRPKYQYRPDPVFQDNIRRLRERLDLLSYSLPISAECPNSLLAFLKLVGDSQLPAYSYGCLKFLNAQLMTYSPKRTLKIEYRTVYVYQGHDIRRTVRKRQPYRWHRPKFK